MSKKILTVLVPVAALIAFMAVPAMSQAKIQAQAPAGTALKAGAAFQGQGTLETKTPGGILKCKLSTFHGTVLKNTGAANDDVEFSVTSTQFDTPDCPTDNPNVFSDVSTNAGAGAAAWKVQVQQPAGNAIVAHIIPGASGLIQFTSQVQAPQGTSVGTCHYKATTVQLEGTKGNHVVTVAAKTEFEVEGQSVAVCGPDGTKATLSGTVQLESGVNKLTFS